MSCSSDKQHPHGQDDIKHEKQGTKQYDERVDGSPHLAVRDGGAQADLDEALADILAVQGVAGNHVEYYKSSG